MRREHGATKKVEIPEKKKREAIMRSIAIEETVITEKKKEKELLLKEIADLEVIAGTIAIENDVADTELSKKKDELFALKSEVEAKTREVDSLEKKVAFLAQKLELTETEIQRIKASHVKDHNDIKHRIEKAKEQEALTIANINGEINFLKEKVAALTITEAALIQSIDTMTREKANLDHAISSRMAELAHINKNLAGSSLQREKAEKYLKEIDERLATAKETLLMQDRLVVAKSEEVVKKEAEVEAKRLELVGLVLREKRVDEKALQIRQMFERAGLSTNI